MIMCHLKNQGLTGFVRYNNNSYQVLVYRHDCKDPFYIMSFNDGVRAEDRLLELLEHPAWTLLKYGK